MALILLLEARPELAPFSVQCDEFLRLFPYNDLRKHKCRDSRKNLVSSLDSEAHTYIGDRDLGAEGEPERLLRGLSEEMFDEELGE